jgi:hypothetical protein
VSRFLYRLGLCVLVLYAIALGGYVGWKWG